jgi:hypothetical protein
MAGAYPQNVCIVAYGPDGAIVGPRRCTDSRIGVLSVSMDFAPLRNGTHVVLVTESSYFRTAGYTISLQCTLGDCGVSPPLCTLKNTATYNAGTLTMNFTVGTLSAGTWNAWLTTQNTIKLLWSDPRAITNFSVVITRTAAVMPAGRVSVLSTLTTPAKGITCAILTTINTGTPLGLTAEPDTEEQFQKQTDEPAIQVEQPVQ